MSSSLQLAPRPEPGKLGKPYPVFCNAFRVLQYPTCIIYHYDMITPAPEDKRTASFILLSLMTSSPALSVACAFDSGVKNFFSLQELFKEGSMTFDIVRRRIQYQVTLRKVAHIKPDELNAILDGRGQGFPISSTPIQALNIFAQQAASLKFPVHTKTKYFVDAPGTTVSIGCLEIWKGFYQSVRPSLGELFVNVDTTSGIMYRRGGLVDFSLNILGTNNIRELEGLGVKDVRWSRLRGLLKGVKVIQVEPKPGRLRTIKTLQPRAGEFAFRLKDGGEITVEQYFKTQHNITVKRGLPGIVTTKDEVIPFHLCVIKEGQLFKKKLPADAITQLLEYTKQKPNDRLKAIKAGMIDLDLDRSVFSVHAGLRTSKNPMQIVGRIIEPPSVFFGGARIQPVNGSWNMLQKRLFRPGAIDRWHVVNFVAEIRDPTNFVGKLAIAMNVVGIEIRNPPEIRPGNPLRVKEELESIYNSAGTDARGRSPVPPTLIIAILPEECHSIRTEIKRYGDILHGVPTQCIRKGNVIRSENQLLNNLILKINAKIGGYNSFAKGKTFRGFETGKTMIIGADVSHPGPGVMRPSVVALVNSVDVNCAHYVSSLAIQDPRLEIIENLGGGVKHCLHMFHKYRQFARRDSQDIVWPEQIIFYRDGVSEGEIQRVVEEEIKGIRDILADMEAHVGKRPKLTFIVVGKRHHMRFFPKDKTPNRDGNAPAGLVVDEQITAPGIFDFYLQSQAGLLGTSRPSHYIVVYDENHFKSDELQDLSYTLCHNYARSTRSVSIPAPCYYADIACSRAEIHFNPELNFTDDLSSSDGQFNMKA